MIQTLRIFPILFLSIALVISCKKEDPEPVNTGDVTYEGDIKSIVSNNCSSCHFGSTPSAGLSLSSKSDVQAAIESNNLLGRINNSSSPMPQGGLMSQGNRDKFQSWKDQGYN